MTNTVFHAEHPTTVFNKGNKGHLTGHYPLFLGDDLGLYDTINITYPELDKLYVEQMSQIWNEFEVDLTQDKMDMLTADRDTVDLMVKTVSWQHLVDSIANRSIAPLLTQYVTNSELEAMLNAQTLFETIHARTYSHIVKQTFANPVEMLENTYNDMDVLMRSEVIVAAFDNLKNLPRHASEFDTKRAILLAFVALFALEAIAFMASFAVTFAITDTGIFQGIGKNVILICRDEVLHARMDYAVLNILQKDSSWNAIFASCGDDIRAILDEVVTQEIKWAEHLFSDGRSVIGLNFNLLKDYILFMANPLYVALNVGELDDVPTKQPLPYMDKYVSSTKIQAAAQEIQITNYKIGAIKDDTDGLDLDLDF